MKNAFNLGDDIPDLTGQTHLVSGGSAGIGFGIIANLLQHNPEKIYMLSNSEEHAKTALGELQEFGPADRVEWIQCDFANLQQTNEVSQRLKTKITRLDSLVANAGIGVGKYWETQDGLENHFQINYLAQVILIMTLLPTLLSTSINVPNSSPRLVLMSSDLHRAAPNSTFTSASEINTDLGPMVLYNRSKLTQVLYARRLQAEIDAGKHGKGKVYVNATHPGGVSTGQQEQAVEAYGTLGKIGVKAVRPLLSDPVKEGCKSGVFAATALEVVSEDVRGGYIVPERKVVDPSTQAMDEKLGKQLWVLSETLLKERFDGKLPWSESA